MSNRDQFFSPSNPTPSTVFLPLDYKGGDLLSINGKEYLRSGRFIPYDTKYSALIGTGMDQYKRPISVFYNYKVMVNGVYEWWFKTKDIHTLTNAASFNGYAAHKYYRCDSNGVWQLMCVDPDIIDLVVSKLSAVYGPVQTATIQSSSPLGVLNGAKTFVRWVLLTYYNMVPTAAVKYIPLLIYSNDGFNWKFKIASALSSDSGSILNYNQNTYSAGSKPDSWDRAPSTDDYFVNYIIDNTYAGQVVMVYDKELNLVWSKALNGAADTMQPLVGPDGFLYTTGAYFTSFGTWTTGYGALGGAAQTYGQNSCDVSEKSWVIAGSYSSGATVYKEVGAPTAGVPGNTSLAMTGTFGNPGQRYFVRYGPGGNWQACSVETGSTSGCSYRLGASVANNDVFTLTTTAAAYTSEHVSGWPLNHSYTFGRCIVNGIQLASDKFVPMGTSGMTAILLGDTSTKGYWGFAFVYLNGLYYTYGKNGTKLEMFSSPDLRNWTWLSETTCASSDYISVFKVVNGTIFISDTATLWTTTDGITLTSRTTGVTKPYDVEYISGTYIVSGNTAANTHATATTLAGTWTLGRCGTGTKGYRMANNGTTVVMTTNDATSKVYYTTNGTVWSNNTYTGANVSNIVYDGSRFVAMDNAAFVFAISANGQGGWTTTTSNNLTAISTSLVDTSVAPPAFVYKGGKYYTGSATHGGFESTDLLNWKPMLQEYLMGHNFQGTVQGKPILTVSMANNKVFGTTVMGLDDWGNGNITEFSGPSTPVLIGYRKPILVDGAIGYIRIK